MIDPDLYSRARAGDRAPLIAALEDEGKALAHAFGLIVRARMASHYLRAALLAGDAATDAERDEYPFTERAHRDAIAALPFTIETGDIDHD